MCGEVQEEFNVSPATFNEGNSESAFHQPAVLDWQVQITSRTERSLDLEREEGLVSERETEKTAVHFNSRIHHSTDQWNNLFKQATNATNVPATMSTFTMTVVLLLIYLTNNTFNYWTLDDQCLSQTLRLNQICSFKYMTWHTEE